MKFLLKPTLLLLFFLPTLLFAGHVNPDKAKTVARNFYVEKASQVNKPVDHELQFNPVQIVKYKDKEVYYSFNVSDNLGFVLIACSDLVSPVIGYSFEGSYQTENQPSQIRDWMNQYADQIIDAIDNNLPQDDQTRELWLKYSSTHFYGEKSISNVNPLVTSTWDQGCYYNQMCPIDNQGPCNRVWAGCVATAMGMVMKYHNYPAQGTGSFSYASPYGTQSANFGSTNYNWTGMPNEIFSNNAAIATLLYHCGVSVTMAYGSNGSGAYTQDVRSALVNYFNYSTSAQYVQRMSYSNTNWQNLLKADLDAGRPIVYSGQDPSFGHCFVLDGYQGTNYFHFNWGWSGWNNGYFYLDNMNSGNGTFNNAQAAVVHIVPSTYPTADFTASSTTMCSETSVQFHDNSIGNPTSWSWQFPGGTPSTSTLADPIVTYNVAGQHNVVLTVSNAASSHTLTKTNYIKVKAKPYGNFPDDTLACDNNPITLDAGNTGGAYTWSTGATSQTITFDSTGMGYTPHKFYVEIFSPEGCWNLDSITVQFGSCAGIETIEEKQITLFPNPAKNMICFSNFTTLGSSVVVEIVSLQGQLLQREILESQTGVDPVVNLSGLGNGIYLVHIRNGKYSFNDKIIISH